MKKARWHTEIETFLPVKPCIILEGNVLDRFQYPSDLSHVHYLPMYLYLLLKERGYSCVVLYDETKGFQAFPDGEEDLRAFAEVCGGVPGVHLKDGTIPCPFLGSRCSSATTAVPKGEQANEAVQASIGEVIEAAVAQPWNSVAIIMDMASRYIVSPDNMDLADVHAYTELLRAIRKSEEAGANGCPVKNALFLLVNKVNDLPPWLYLNNPDVKTIHISVPDRQERLEFVSGTMLSQFFEEDIYTAQMSAYENNPAKLIKIQEQFAGITEGFAYTDLLGVRKICFRGDGDKKYGISDLPQLVDLYRYGIKNNKWLEDISKDTVQRLKESLKENVLGQEDAHKAVLNVVKSGIMEAKGGVCDTRPKGILFFAGATGTGKTETAKILAETLFGDKRCLVRFDMSEYKQEHSDQKLLGAPPGYIGYEAGGQLTNAVRNNPFCVLLFDEIEKAAPSILDKFLQILDDGRLTDGQGNTVYFSETIIIFTSNEGVLDEVTREPIVDASEPYPVVREKVRAGIRNYFQRKLGRPELLNRIGEDNIVVFNFMTPEVTEKILKLHVDKVIAEFKAGYGVEVDVTQVMDAMAERCKSKDVARYNGRGIRNVVESCLKVPLRTYYLDHEEDIPAGSRIVVSELSLDKIPVEIAKAEVSP